MWLRSTALAVFAAASCLPAWAQPPETLALDDTFVRVIQSHSDLRLNTGPDHATLRTASVAGFHVVGVLGTGRADGFKATSRGQLDRGFRAGAHRQAGCMGYAGRTLADALTLQPDASRLDRPAQAACRHLAIIAAQIA